MWLFFTFSNHNLVLQDLESKNVVDELKMEFENLGKHSLTPQCISLAWSADGQFLFSGHTDNLIRVWQVSHI